MGGGGVVSGQTFCWQLRVGSTFRKSVQEKWKNNGFRKSDPWTAATAAVTVSFSDPAALCRNTRQKTLFSCRVVPVWPAQNTTHWEYSYIWQIFAHWYISNWCISGRRSVRLEAWGASLPLTQDSIIQVLFIQVLFNNIAGFPLF